MKNIIYSISLLLFISLIGCEDKSDTNPDDNVDNKEVIHRGIVFGEHKIDTIFTDEGEISIDIDNDNKNDIKITYYKYVDIKQDCDPIFDSIDSTWKGCETEIYRLLGFRSLNDSVFLCVYTYDEIYLFDNNSIDFNGLKWKSSFGNYIPIEFIDEENYLPIKIIINNTSIYYGWIYFKCDGVSRVELINYKILE